MRCPKATPPPVVAPLATGKGFKAIAVNHISYGVADYGWTRDFYSDLLGMKVTYDDGRSLSIYDRPLGTRMQWKPN